MCKILPTPIYKDSLLSWSSPPKWSPIPNLFSSKREHALGFHEAILAVVFLQGLRVSESQSNHPDSKGKNKETRGIVVKGRSATHKAIQNKRATWDIHSNSEEEKSQEIKTGAHPRSWPASYRAGDKRSTLQFAGAQGADVHLIIYSLSSGIIIGPRVKCWARQMLSLSSCSLQRKKRFLSMCWTLSRQHLSSVQQLSLQTWVKINRIQATAPFGGLISYSVDKTMSRLARQNTEPVKSDFQVNNQ